MLLQFIKFCLVGASGMILDFSLTYFLKEKINLHRYAANATGFLCAASSNFALNRYWTFESRNPDVYHELVSFIAFALAGVILNTVFLFYFEKQNLNFYLSKFFAVVLTTIWNFTTNYFFTFHGA
jgi:putative flippase GtrA